MRMPKTNLLKFIVKSINKSFIVNSELSTLNNNSRRKFLKESAKGALAVGVVSTLPSFITSCKSNQSNGNTSEAGDGKNIKIAIIGGGIAGLSCGYHLQKSGIDFKIYESSKRLGGRILTHYNDSLRVGIFPEFRGEFIDSNHVDMLNFVKEFNLEIIDLEKEQLDKGLIKDVYYFNNKKYTEDEVIKEFSKISDKIRKDKDSLGENYDTESAISLDNTSLDISLNSLNCAEWLKELLSAAFVAEFGLDCSEQSSLNFIDLISPETDNGFKVFGDSDERYKIKGGNSKIIENLVSRIGEDKIFKDYTLKRIKDTDDNKYQLSFENGEEIIADYVVLTIPFTILRNIVLDVKSLTKEKKQCIDELGYGVNTKLILAYEGQPWRDIPNKAMGYLFHKDISNGWDGSYNKTNENPYGAYVCFFGGAYSENLNKLSFKYPNAPASHVWKTQVPDASVNYLTNELNKVFTGSKKKFLNKHVFVNWIDYPYTKGSYSCYKVGQWTSISGLEIESVGNIFFAGEHCSENFQGYMNGGAETGRIAAENLSKIISKTNH